MTTMGEHDGSPPRGVGGKHASLLDRDGILTVSGIRTRPSSSSGLPASSARSPTAAPSHLLISETTTVHRLALRSFIATVRKHGWHTRARAARRPHR